VLAADHERWSLQLLDRLVRGQPQLLLLGAWRDCAAPSSFLSFFKSTRGTRVGRPWAHCHMHKHGKKPYSQMVKTTRQFKGLLPGCSEGPYERRIVCGWVLYLEESLLLS